MLFHIWTAGCQMNKADSAKLAAGLRRLGLRETALPDDANLVVLNTCAVREHAETRAIGRLTSLKRLKTRRNGDLKIALMGCMVGTRTDELERRFPFVDVFARPQQFDAVIAALGLNDLGGEFWPAVFPEAEGPAAFVPVAYGCNKFCSYCIVPYRRGRERSRTIDDVRAEVRHLSAAGVREVTLLGQTIESYGRDLPDEADLADLLRAVHGIDGIERVRFLTSHPGDLTERIVRAIAELPKVCECFSLPVQSGSDAVLRSMRRGYTVDEYRRKIALIREAMPHAAITTDVIAGFCGETEADFQATHGLLADLRFDKVHVAAYSPRPGTIAERKMPDDVPPEVKQARLRAVEELQERIASEINSRFVDTDVEVLVEGRDNGRPHGRTRGDKLVHFEGDAAAGEIVRVRIEHASAWSMRGVRRS